MDTNEAVARYGLTPQVWSNVGPWSDLELSSEAFFEDVADGAIWMMAGESLIVGLGAM